MGICVLVLVCEYLYVGICKWILVCGICKWVLVDVYMYVGIIIWVHVCGYQYMNKVW